MNPSSHQSIDPRFTSSFDTWLVEQESDLEQLLAVLPNTANGASNSNAGAAAPTDDQLRQLVSRVLLHFEEYAARRWVLSVKDPPVFFCPPWCSSFENSFLWLGGCRPSMAIHLVNMQSNSAFQAHLQEFLAGGPIAVPVGSAGMLGLTIHQLTALNELRTRTLRDEDELSAKMALLQEDVAGNPMLTLAKNSLDPPSGGGHQQNGSGGGEVRGAMEQYAQKLARVLEEADRLRIRTVREVATEILTPQQAVEMLAAGKQLHLAVHNWGKTRDRERESQRN